MSYWYFNWLTVKPVNQKGIEELKDFKEKCKTDEEVFSLNRLHPIPDHLKFNGSNLGISNGVVSVNQTTNKNDPIINLLKSIIKNSGNDLKANEELLKCLSKSTEDNDPIDAFDKFFAPREWMTENWGARSDTYGSKVISDKVDKYVVEFQLSEGYPNSWLVKVSKDYPNLHFCDVFFESEVSGESLIEVENGSIFNHEYIINNAIPGEITSNSICDYKDLTLLTPKLKDKPYIISLIVLEPSLVLVNVKDMITKLSCSKVIDKYFYRGLMLSNIRKTCDENNVAILVSPAFDGDEPSIEYSTLIYSQTIEEAKEKITKLIDEFHRYDNDIITKIKTLLKEEFSMGTMND